VDALKVYPRIDLSGPLSRFPSRDSALAKFCRWRLSKQQIHCSPHLTSQSARVHSISLLAKIQWLQTSGATINTASSVVAAYTVAQYRALLDSGSDSLEECRPRSMQRGLRIFAAPSIEAAPKHQVAGRNSVYVAHVADAQASEWRETLGCDQPVQQASNMSIQPQ
jgi:hypothetical protein